jgi:hypothetical protein
MNGIKIRNACLDDAAATARLVTQLGYATTDLEMKERLGGILPEPNYMTFVAEHEAEVVNRKTQSRGAPFLRKSGLP